MVVFFTSDHDLEIELKTGTIFDDLNMVFRISFSFDISTLFNFLGTYFFPYRTVIFKVRIISRMIFIYFQGKLFLALSRFSYDVGLI